MPYYLGFLCYFQPDLVGSLKLPHKAEGQMKNKNFLVFQKSINGCCCFFTILQFICFNMFFKMKLKKKHAKIVKKNNWNGLYLYGRISQVGFIE